MAEFGAVLCARRGCHRHDFLPFVCAACGLTFCLEHRSFRSHGCEKGEVSLTFGQGEEAEPSQRSSHPLSSNKPSELMEAVVTRFHGRENELNADVTHYNIKASAKRTDEGTQDMLLRRSQLVVERSTTAKGRRVSSQVHRMLLKSKAVGDNRLQMSDRFFLEVRYWGNEQTVHHMFFSRLWTVGRTLDKIVELHRGCLRLDPGQEGCMLDLVREGSIHRLPLGTTC
ncbi:unnamed protein product [Choristocarpus tenellus]